MKRIASLAIAATAVSVAIMAPPSGPTSGGRHPPFVVETWQRGVHEYTLPCHEKVKAATSSSPLAHLEPCARSTQELGWKLNLV